LHTILLFTRINCLIHELFAKIVKCNNFFRFAGIDNLLKFTLVCNLSAKHC
jgi:hypothetical protein